MLSEPTYSIASLICDAFKGRSDLIAIGNENGAFAPHAVEAIDPAWIAERHLAGVQPLGFYLLTPESKCWCACIDLDNKPHAPDPAWLTKAEQIYFRLIDLGLQPLVEVSQSGNAAHVWLFFDEPIDAWVPRAFFRSLLADLGIPVREVYPKQDRLTGKGVGSLVRYPLWNAGRFIDPESANATIDPVEALTGLQRYSAADLRMIAWKSGLGNLAEPVAVASDDADGLPGRVRELVSRSWTLLGRRWLGDTRGMADTSPSAVVMAIATELVRQYVPTLEIEAAVHHWCRVHECGAYDRRSKESRDAWVTATVRKAYDFCVARTESKSVDIKTFQSAALEYVDSLEEGNQAVIPSGIPPLDLSIDGVSLGEMAVLAARPSHGKSAVAFQWLDNAASMGIPCAIISEEMSSREIGKRRLQSITKIPYDMWSQELCGHFRAEIEAHHMTRAPVYVVENCNSIERVDEVFDQLCSLYGVKMIAVDYLQLLTAKSGDRYQDVTEISRRLKQAAKRNSCAVLALSQLNREIEKRSDYEPKLSDLRESGQIEQDADLVAFLVWPWKFDSQKHMQAEYRIIVAKRRNGPIRNPRVLTTFNPERQIVGLCD